MKITLMDEIGDMSMVRMPTKDMVVGRHPKMSMHSTETKIISSHDETVKTYGKQRSIRRIIGKKWRKEIKASRLRDKREAKMIRSKMGLSKSAFDKKLLSAFLSGPLGVPYHA